MATSTRRRRPAFDREAGVAKAQALFHERGYDAVSVGLSKNRLVKVAETASRVFVDVFEDLDRKESGATRTP